MPRRRELIQQSAAVAALLAGVGLLPLSARAQSKWNAAAFDADTLDAAYKALGSTRPVASAGVSLQAPDIAENGAQVQVTASATLPGVKRLALLVEKNPNVLIALYDFSDAVPPSMGTRIKMAQSSNVYAVAFMADGRVLFAHKDVKVTLGGCGN